MPAKSTYNAQHKMKFTGINWHVCGQIRVKRKAPKKSGDLQKREIGGGRGGDHSFLYFREKLNTEWNGRVRRNSAVGHHPIL